ncbi:hypothetical protein GQ53DRAFT_714839 [Thozetella sp. PMI_491]|nr:hypothetical protein GQ53DRAFT_714839 [Thozetella sp. PMI_491]
MANDNKDPSNGADQASQSTEPHYDTLEADDSTRVATPVDAVEAEAQVARLARTFTETSIVGDVNPFLAKEPTLDPRSPLFDAKLWAKTLLNAFSKDPDRYPRHTVGVSYRDLGVYGFGGTTDYQKNVLNVLWRGPAIIQEAISRRRTKIQILRNFDGLVKRGEMLLVLGRPGRQVTHNVHVFGVSTLLKTISGETNGLHLDESSGFNYQGIPWDIMHKHFKGERIYQAETDVHFPHLTAGQTLLFAALARTPSNRLPGVSRAQYAKQLRDVVMTMFGIYNTMNTKVGDDFIRGVSGGERKRVSIAEVTLNNSAIQCWDNSTRGLDSATALEFARIIRLSTELGDTAAIVAMYQASQPAYDIFDKVAVLYEGRQIYFGPTEEAKTYFTDMGYHCPDRQTTADFLTSLSNPAERTVQSGFENRVPRTPDEFQEAWRTSAARAKLIAEIDGFEREYPLEGQQVEKFKAARKANQANFVRNGSPYTISVPMQVKLCMDRGFQRIMGDKTFFLVTVFGNLAISVILGSVFYDLPDSADGMNNRCILLFFAILFNGLNSALEIFSLYAQRPIVEKHARYALYHPFSEAIASMVCDLPSKLLSTVAFNVPLYFMANLRRDAGHFFIFLLFGITCTLTMSMILRTIGQSSRTIHQALTPAAMFILGLVIYTGFILPTRDMQGWLRWINYLNPIAYAFESLVANEFSGRQFPCTRFVPMGPPYANATSSQMTCSVAGAAPGADFVIGDVYIGALFEYEKAHIWRNFGILIGYILFFVMTYLLAAEYISTSKSKGEVLIFQQGHRSNMISRASADEESGKSNVGEKLPSDALPTGKANADSPLKIQRQEAVLHWKDLCYTVPIKDEKRKILDSVNGWVRPGTLTALMGATGAGKTTLLDVLANRVNVGVVTGDVFVNGYSRGKSFQRKTGYVQQQDLHLETSTVREALRFSAVLRQHASVPAAEKYAYVEEVISLLSMETYADAVIGVPGEGLNVEQRKRLTIGVELAAKPALLLFLDEPTSGLDSQTAWSIATLLRTLSDSGQAILCTIHQPSALLFQQFDRLLLLAKGGRTVYFGDIGPDCRTLIDYFEGKLAVPCGADENPAEWMLKVIGAAPGAHTDRDWADTWRSSPEYTTMRRDLEQLETLRTIAADPDAGEETGTAYAAPFHVQFIECTKRVFQQYWRTPSYIYSKLILCGGTSLFIGVSFYKAPMSMQGLQDQMFSIFMLMVIFAFLVYQTMPYFIIQREQYEARERSSKAYAWYVFVLANIVVELPWAIFAALLVFFPFYYLVGMYQNATISGAVTERGGLMFFLMLTFMLFESTFADMVIAGIETSEVGATAALLLFAISLIFCGVMAPPNALPGFWIFMYRVSPFTYLISSMLATGLGNTGVQCSSIELLQFDPAKGLNCQDYMAPYMSLAGGKVYNPTATEACLYCPLAETNSFLASVAIDFDDRWRNLGISWAYIAFNIFATLGLYWLARVPRKVIFIRARNLAMQLTSRKKTEN